MAKKSTHGGRRLGAGRPKSERDDVPVKIDRTLVARARYVSEIRGVSLPQYLTDSLRSAVNKDFDDLAQHTKPNEVRSRAREEPASPPPAPEINKKPAKRAKP